MKNKIKILNENIENTDLVRVEIDHVVCIKHKDQLKEGKKK